MKTTIELDDDVAEIVRSRILEGKTIREVVNTLLRQGIWPAQAIPYPTFDMGEMNTSESLNMIDARVEMDHLESKWGAPSSSKEDAA